MLARKIALLTLLGTSLSTTALAELPVAGTTMDAVRGEYGEPQDTTLPIGQPEITRWVYDSFNVVFEDDRVIKAYPRITPVEQRKHSEIPGRPDFVQGIDQSVNDSRKAKPAQGQSVIQATDDEDRQDAEREQADEAAATIDAPEAPPEAP
ncbi:MAG: hypothetical protein ACQES2_07545 [Pseudomonadota bacterium]